MYLSTITFVHVAVSLFAIGAGFVVVHGFLKGRRLDGWNAAFLGTTIATSASGYLFPFEKLLPSHALGAISLVVLGVAVYARYGRHLAGRWSTTYVVTALAAFYLNFFVLVVQSFLKVPALRALAPTQTEAPFAVAQLVVLVAFVAMGYFATSRQGMEARFARGQFD
ncbi:MAG: hypothetical protein KF708_14500 [Pirellulales bacterium]|nr:hypothetical protein [Pirellulales bacterium]